MDDLKKLTQGFVQAAQVGPVQSAIPEMTNFFKAQGMDSIVKRGMQAGAGLAGQKGKEADQADEAARAAAEANTKKKLDPSNYRIERKTDGGFSFYDPDGKEIDINTYSQRTGRSRQDVLSDSENPVDQAYLNDYKRMQEGIQVMYGGDDAEKQAFLQANPELKGRNVQDFAMDLIKKYPHIYGYGGNGKQAYQQTLKNQGSSIFKPAYGGGGGLASLGM